MRARLLAVLPLVATVFGAAATVHASTVVVYVLPHEFSINAPSDPNIQDAVVTIGDTVHWNFTDPFHSVTSVTGSTDEFDSGIVLQLPFSFEHTFTRVGVFHYYCVFHGWDNGDGTADGMAGTITVLPGGPTCDSIDFNGDTLFPDTQDITDFITVFGGGECPTGPGGCGDIDFNNDGLFPDTQDIESFLIVFAGGECV